MPTDVLEPTDVLDQNKTIVSRWIDEVFNRKNLAAIEELKFLSYLDWTPHPSQRLDLPVSGLKQSLPEFFAALPDFQFTAENLSAEGDMVVCLGSWHGTHCGDFMGVAPTNRRLTGTRIDIFRIAGDKMAEHWGCGGELASLQLLGVIPAPELRVTEESDIKAIAREFVEHVVNRRNLAAIEALVDDHAVDHPQQALTMFFILAAFPDYRVDVREVLADGEQVTVLSDFGGTHRAEFMGIPPTGREVTGTRTDTFRIVDGKITESWLDWNSSSLVDQLTA